MVMNIKKIFYISFALVLIMQTFSYAKRVDVFNKEVKAPEAEKKTNVSEAVIIDANSKGMKEYSPINPYPVGFNKEEYDSVDNTTISFDTLETRIKWFSPTYLNAKESGSNSAMSQYHILGGNETATYSIKNYSSDMRTDLDNAKDVIREYKDQLRNLDKNSPTYIIDFNTLKATITIAETQYAGYKMQYNALNTYASTIYNMFSSRKALYAAATIDNNGKLVDARERIASGLKSAILSYLKLEIYVELLSKQTSLYKDMYEIKKKNYDLGTATSLDVTNSLNTYETVKKDYNTNKALLKNTKEQIAINLGYKPSEIDSLKFVEPDIDLVYIDSINFDSDKDKAYNSNTTYQSISLSKKDKKLPQSTGEEIFRKRQKSTGEKVITELERLYGELQAAIYAYSGSECLAQVVALTEEANMRKLQNNLVSKVEFDGLEIQNLANKLSVKTAKYDLINATNQYYYATRGQTTIS